MEHLALAVLAIAVLVLVVRDVMARRRMSELRRELRDADARSRATTGLAAVGELVSGLAHDLKTPIQGVLGNTEVMLATREHGVSDELRDIHDHATRAAGIVRNLIAYSEASTLARRWQDLNELAMRAIDAAHAQISPRPIQFVPAERLPLVYVDGRQLEKAVAVLLGRAVPGETGPVPPAIVVSTELSPGRERLAIDIEFRGVPQDAVESALSAGELDASRHVIEAHGGRLLRETRTNGAGARIELPAGPLELADSAPSQTPTAQESSSSWTTLSTSSTSTATGTSTN